MMLDPQAILPAVIDAALAAGRMVADEFALPTGPRLIDNVTAPIDREIELFLRVRLLRLVSARFVGEEAGIVAAEANGLCWVVDPHDGTRAFLEGKRGSAVSIALLRAGVPILGVVYAPLSPDRGPDLIAWAEGGGITRNGAPVMIDLRERELAATDVVFLNHGVWQRPVWNTIACAPARFMPLPSIAYRIARIAVGDGIATQTLRPVNALDIAAGHALLLAAGGVLVAEDGQPVSYNELGESRPSACFGGAPKAVTALLTRPWRGSTETRREPRVTLDWPRAADGVALDRATGCLLGLAIGDALGSAVEFQTAASIAAAYPGGVRDLMSAAGSALPPGDAGSRAVRADDRARPPDESNHGLLAGQATDDTELALALARTLIGHKEYDAEAAAGAYGAWLASGAHHVGRTTARAFAAAMAVPNGKAAAARLAADRDSQSNGSLMRVAPIGIWARDAEHAAEAAAADSALSHPNPVCIASCVALTSAIVAGIAGADRPGMIRMALAGARRIAGGDAAAAAIEAAAAGHPPREDPARPGFVLTTLGHAFHHLAVGTDAETALIRIVGSGGDTDTNAAVAGALLGAADGRLAFPPRWVMPVLTCRPDAGLAIAQPRPDIYWTDDLIDLAEALLTRQGQR